MASKHLFSGLRNSRTVRMRGHGNGTVRSRCFSFTSSTQLMEMTGFTQEQLEVREAVAKICANYPDVRMLTSRALGHH